MFRILVVDDDRNTRLYLQVTLEEEGYKVFTAENGEEKVYTIIAKRAAAHGDMPTQPTIQPTTMPTADPTEAPTQPSALPSDHVCQPDGVNAIWVIIPWTMFAAAAVVIIVLLKKK